MVSATDALKEAKKAAETLVQAKSLNRIRAPVPEKPWAGFLLLHSVKGAAVLGFERGHGLLFRTADYKDDAYTLSAPVFVKTTKLAVGIQLGYSEVFTLLFLTDEAQIRTLASESGETIMGRDFEMTGATKNPGSQGAGERGHKETTLLAVDDGLHVKPVAVSVSDSIMVFDLSLYGGTIEVDKKPMGEVYPKEEGTELWVTPAEVLGNGVPVPEAFQATLAEIVASINQVASVKA